jgi:hypothetical protein
MRQVLLAFVFAVAGLGCSSAAVAPTPTRYPAAVRENFLSSCGVQGTLKACECVLDYLERQMTYGEFVALEAAGAEAVQADDRIKTAVAMCQS